nr:MAG TPA: hypothetical protein [Caudoviricetes sp.]
MSICGFFSKKFEKLSNMNLLSGYLIEDNSSSERRGDKNGT